MQLILGDCLEVMKSLPDKSVDLILTDPPYGTTACKWDTIIPFEPMWKELKRIRKDNAAICLFGSEPFSSHLRLSNIKEFKYDWYWKKTKSPNFLYANKMPHFYIESISVFYKKCNYYPEKQKSLTGYIAGQKKGVEYNATSTHKLVLGIINAKIKYSKNYEYGKILPGNLIEFSNYKKKSQNYHPTQKPVGLLEYLIKTYTLENETVLDFTMGSGSTGVACKNLNRKFIGIEKEEKYFEIARNRING